MNIEHVGYMVEKPVEVAAWYVANLEFTVKRAMTASPFTHFLVDGAGRMMLEIYNNPKAQVPDYRTLDPLVLHLAFRDDDVPGTRARLLAAGATPEGDVVVTAGGDELAMLRDPWGFAIQLCKRKEPMV